MIQVINNCLFRVALTCLAVLIMVLSSQRVGRAYSPAVIRSLINGTYMYDPSRECGVAKTGDFGNTFRIPANLSPTQKVQAFVDTYGQMAYNDALLTAVPWEVTLAQAIVESAYGNSAPGNNFFGIKAGSSWTGPTQVLTTSEQDRGKIKDRFRVYASPQESFNDHSKFLRENSRYWPAFQFSNDPLQFLIKVKAGGYATADDYVNTVGRVMQQIINYNSQTKKFTPSSEIKFDVPLPTKGGTTKASTSSSAAASSNVDCQPKDATLGISGNFAFPLLTTQTAVKAGGWCHTSQSNCHHHYNAADIFSETGTPVVAATSGTVVSASNGKPPEGGHTVGSRVTIKGDDEFVYYYAHMGYNSLTVKKGEHVNMGSPLGKVGTSHDAEDTKAHLHFDILPESFSHRPSCSSAECIKVGFINPQPFLTKAFESLQP